MKFDTITTIAWLVALSLSFDTTAVAAKKFHKSSKSHKQKKCSQVLYYSLSDEGENIQLYNAGPPALGNQICIFQITGPPAPDGTLPGFEVCEGDRVIFPPFNVFADDDLTNRVGFFTSTRTIVKLDETIQSAFQSARDLATIVLVFDEGSNAGSEIVFGGLNPLPMTEMMTGGGAKYAITGGVGDFVGISGDTDLSISSKENVMSFIINCH